MQVLLERCENERKTGSGYLSRGQFLHGIIEPLRAPPGTRNNVRENQSEF